MAQGEDVAQPPERGSGFDEDVEAVPPLLEDGDRPGDPRPAQGLGGDRHLAPVGQDGQRVQGEADRYQPKPPQVEVFKEAVGDEGEGQELEPASPRDRRQPAGERESLRRRLQQGGGDEDPAGPQLGFDEVLESCPSEEGCDDSNHDGCCEYFRRNTSRSRQTGSFCQSS